MDNSAYLSKRGRINSVLNYSFRALGILSSLLYTRFTLGYLGDNLYGIWATITSVATWVNTGDLGIGNGLRNELSVVVARGETTAQKKLVSYSVIVLSLVSLGLFAGITVLTEILIATHVMDSVFRIPMYITNGFFCLDLVFGIARSAAYGLQMSWLTTFAQTTTSVSRTIVAFVLLKTAASAPSLTLFSVLTGLCAVFGNALLVIIIMRKTRWRNLLGVFTYFDRTYRRRILKLGISFFVIQIACLVLYSTDNIIIKGVLSAEAVTQYEIINRVYMLGDNLFSILLISFWSSVTAAATLNNFVWIEKEIKKILVFWLLFSLGVILVSILFNFIVKIWLGENAIHYDAPLIVLFAAYTILTTFGSIFVNAANGLNRLRIQIVSAVISCIVNIPLSILFATVCGLGIFGVKLATLICCFGSIVVVPIDVSRYLRMQLKKGAENAE